MATCEICGKKYYSKKCLYCNPLQKSKNINQIKSFSGERKTHQTKIHKKTMNEKPFYINKHPKHANFLVRFLASLIDAMLLIPIYLLFQNDIISEIIGGIIIILLWILWDGQTIGKKTLNLQIVNEDYTSIDKKQAMIRYLGYYLSMIILFLGYIIIPFRKDKRALHDILAKTYVIHTDREEDYEDSPLEKVSAIIIFIIGVPFIISVLILNEEIKIFKKVLNKTTKSQTIYMQK